MKSGSLSATRSERRTSRAILTREAVRKLARWYGRNHRDLPWRRTKDPYSIWISEIFLQQTQVETVRPYFFRFIRAFPTVESLAAASLDSVLKAWEGCGYYARARNLHRAAQQIAANSGQLPRRAAEWQRLPGVGPYTAAAIASIVDDEPVPVIDGNVSRVLARVTLTRGQLKRASTQKRLRRAAEGVMALAVESGIRPGLLNQALMELGATLCRPRAASCERCPLRDLCRARKQLRDVTALPSKSPAKKLPHYQIGTAIIRRRGRVLIAQRPLDTMLGGLWEFPGGKRDPNETLPECVAREIREELGIDIEVGPLMIKVDHSYSHFRITLHAFECRPLRGRARKLEVADFRWVRPEELSTFAFPKADRVIIEKLMGDSK